MSTGSAESRMAALLRRLEQLTDDLSFRLAAAVTGPLRQQQRRVADLTAAVLRHDPRQKLAQVRERLATTRTRLDRALERMIHASAATVNSLDARLHSLSPLAVLDRGYALVLNAEGGLVRSTLQLTQGDQVTTRLADGSFLSRVESSTPNKTVSKKKTKK